METISLKKTLLQKLIKQSVKEAIIEERKNLYNALIPTVSQAEMNDIRKRYKRNKKNGKNEFKDLTDWVLH